MERIVHGARFHVSLKHGKALYQNGFKSGRSWALSLFSPALASEKSKTSFLIPLHAVEVMNSRAFSSEVDTGSREENAIKQRSRDVFRFHGIGKRSSDANHCVAQIPLTSPSRFPVRFRLITQAISRPPRVPELL
jgi:hypothetical protein